jgi:hypothetical protein
MHKTSTLRRRPQRLLRALALAQLFAMACAGTEPTVPDASKGFVNFFAADASPNYSVSVNGQVVGRLTRQYSQSTCFQSAASALPPEGTVTLPIFRGQNYAVRVQYDNGTFDVWNFAPTQEEINRVCNVVSVTRN